MSTNPYAPPAAKIDDVAPAEVSPRLWNPVAAARWSILFSPAFGAILHMLNWQALGEPARARGSRNWAIAVLATLLAGAFIGLLSDGASRALSIGTLLVWYFISGRTQSVYVRERYGKQYVRRGWSRPLLAGLAVYVALILLIGLGLFFAGETAGDGASR